MSLPASHRPCSRRSGLSRRIAWFAAFALVAFAPRVLWAAAHDHGLVQAASESCGACVIAHAPAATETDPPVLPAPHVRALVQDEALQAVRPAGFSFAAPLACGPPRDAGRS